MNATYLLIQDMEYLYITYHLHCIVGVLVKRQKNQSENKGWVCVQLLYDHN